MVMDQHRDVVRMPPSGVPWRQMGDQAVMFSTDYPYEDYSACCRLDRERPPYREDHRSRSGSHQCPGASAPRVKNQSSSGD